MFRNNRINRIGLGFQRIAAKGQLIGKKLAMANRRLGEAGGIRVFSDANRIKRTLEDNGYASRIFRKPDFGVEGLELHEGYRFALEQNIDEKTLADREKMLAISHEAIESPLYLVLTALMISGDIKSVKELYSNGLKPLDEKLAGLQLSEWQSRLKSQKAVLLIEPNVEGGQ